MTLIQSAVCGYEVLLDLTEKLHKNYCDKYDIKYLVFRERTRDNRTGYWDVYDRILEILLETKDNETVLFLDADSIIIDLNQSLNILPNNYDIGMVPSLYFQRLEKFGIQTSEEKWSYWKSLPKFISNAIWIRKTQSNINLIKRVVEMGPIENPMHWVTQATLMYVLNEMKLPVFSMDRDKLANIIKQPIFGGPITLSFKINAIKNIIGGNI